MFFPKKSTQPIPSAERTTNKNKKTRASLFPAAATHALRSPDFEIDPPFSPPPPIAAGLREGRWPLLRLAFDGGAREGRCASAWVLWGSQARPGVFPRLDPQVGATFRSWPPCSSGRRDLDDGGNLTPSRRV